MSKIIWAIDAFDSHSSLYLKTAKILKTICTPGKIQIEPVFLCMKEEFLFVDPFITSVSSTEFEKVAMDALQKNLKKIKLNLLTKPKVLVSDGLNKRSSLKLLTDYAKKENARFIAVSTYARKGLHRFFVGSFAETLLLHSPVPLLFVHPKVKPMSRVKKIFFPTDLSQKSLQAFKKVVEFSLQFKKAEIVLFHQIPNPLEPYLNAGMQLFGGNYQPVSQYLDDERQNKTKKLQEWSKDLKQMGIPSKVVIETRVRPISESILKHARAQSASLIAMESEAGLLTSTLVGSIGRQVIRGSTCPVWILHKN